MSLRLRSSSAGAAPRPKLRTTSRAESAAAVALDVRCACQFFQTTSLLPERINPISSSPTSRSGCNEHPSNTYSTELSQQQQQKHLNDNFVFENVENGQKTEFSFGPVGQTEYYAESITSRPSSPGWTEEELKESRIEPIQDKPANVLNSGRNLIKRSDILGRVPDTLHKQKDLGSSILLKRRSESQQSVDRAFKQRDPSESSVLRKRMNLSRGNLRDEEYEYSPKHDDRHQAAGLFERASSTSSVNRYIFIKQRDPSQSSILRRKMYDQNLSEIEIQGVVADISNRDRHPIDQKEDQAYNIASNSNKLYSDDRNNLLNSYGLEYYVKDQGEKKIEANSNLNLYPQTDLNLEPQRDSNMFTQSSKKINPQLDLKLNPQLDINLGSQSDLKLNAQPELNLYPQQDLMLYPQSDPKVENILLRRPIERKSRLDELKPETKIDKIINKAPSVRRSRLDQLFSRKPKPDLTKISQNISNDLKTIPRNSEQSAMLAPLILTPNRGSRFIQSSNDCLPTVPQLNLQISVENLSKLNEVNKGKEAKKGFGSFFTSLNKPQDQRRSPSPMQTKTVEMKRIAEPIANMPYEKVLEMQPLKAKDSLCMQTPKDQEKRTPTPVRSVAIIQKAEPTAAMPYEKLLELPHLGKKIMTKKLANKSQEKPMEYIVNPADVIQSKVFENYEFRSNNMPSSREPSAFREIIPDAQPKGTEMPFNQSSSNERPIRSATPQPNVIKQRDPSTSSFTLNRYKIRDPSPISQRELNLTLEFSSAYPDRRASEQISDVIKQKDLKTSTLLNRRRRNLSNVSLQDRHNSLDPYSQAGKLTKTVSFEFDKQLTSAPYESKREESPSCYATYKPNWNQQSTYKLR